MQSKISTSQQYANATRSVYFIRNVLACVLFNSVISEILQLKKSLNSVDQFSTGVDRYTRRFLTLGSDGNLCPTNDLVHTGVKECSFGGSSFCWFPWEPMCKFMSEVQLLIGRGALWGVILPGALATVALWKSAPMIFTSQFAILHRQGWVDSQQLGWSCGASDMSAVSAAVTHCLQSSRCQRRSAHSQSVAQQALCAAGPASNVAL